MWIWLDKNGKVQQYLTHGSSPVVGRTDFQIFAYFDGADIGFFENATIKFRKPDQQGSTYPVLFMKKMSMPYTYDSSDGSVSLFKEADSPYTGFLFDFADFTQEDEIVTLLDTPGTWEATITLLGSPNKTNVSGLITFFVGPSTSDSEDQTELSLDQILQNLILATNPIPRSSEYYVRYIDDLKTVSDNSELNSNYFVVNSIVLDGATKTLYRIIGLDINPEDSSKARAYYERLVKYLNVEGDTMEGTIDMDNNRIDNIKQLSGNDIFLGFTDSGLAIIPQNDNILYIRGRTDGEGITINLNNDTDIIAFDTDNNKVRFDTDIDANLRDIEHVDDISVRSISGFDYNNNNVFPYIAPSNTYLDYNTTTNEYLVNSTIRYLKKTQGISIKSCYQDAIIYDKNNNRYLWLMNFDTGKDNCYIDTHLSPTSSIYRGLHGENSNINVSLEGDNSAIGISLNGDNSYIRSVLDGYSIINFYANGDDTNKSLNYCYLSSGYNDDDGIGSNNAPLLFFNKGGTANPNKYGLAFNTETHKLGYITKEDDVIIWHELDFVPILNTQGFKIYAHSGTSQFELDYDILANANTIVQRTANGNVLMTAPTEDFAGVNKVYLESNYYSKITIDNKKLDKLTTLGSYVYAHAGPFQKEITYMSSISSNTIVIRDDGARFQAGIPVNEYDVANKYYVDTAIAKIDQFKYVISTSAATTPSGIVWYSGSTKITGTLVASADTEYIVYLVPCKHSASETQKGYDEYLTINNGTSYSWELLGNTADIDLSIYMKKVADSELDMQGNNINNVRNITTSGDAFNIKSTDNSQDFTIDIWNSGSSAVSEITLSKVKGNTLKQLRLELANDNVSLDIQTTDSNRNTVYADVVDIADDGSVDFINGAKSSVVPQNNNDLVNKEYVDNKVGSLSVVDGQLCITYEN